MIECTNEYNRERLEGENFILHEKTETQEFDWKAIRFKRTRELV